MDINLIKDIIRKITIKSCWVEYSQVCSALKSYELMAVEPGFFLNNNQDFRTYPMCKPNDFYIALAESFPYQMESLSHSLNMPSDKKPPSNWAIDPKIKPRKNKILEQYGIDDTEEDKVFQEIKTVEDLQQVIGKLIKKIARESNQSTIEIQEIGTEFYNVYQVPIRSTLKQFFAALKLMDILQNIEFITVDMVDSKKVFLKKRNSEVVK
ncbi:hypothetical protein [Laspinema sp. D2d]|uniref:hypothetical protein n=1 Tax=Laspinema sp. D2d TaxID=2953686 RepID=UPI0021BA7B72|nr:hypothetical protein [Laspinema sp. D2d]